MPKISTIQIKNSEVLNSVPTLETGELGVNLADLVVFVGSLEVAVPLLGKDYLISSTRYETTTTNIDVPDLAYFLEVIGAGGGGGGGSAYRSASAAATFGGGGGQGGLGGKFLFTVQEMGLNPGDKNALKVIIGQGGTGATAATSTVSTNGNTGYDGGSSYLKSNDDTVIYIEFPGGQGGEAGQASTINNYQPKRFMDRLEGLGGKSTAPVSSLNTGTSNFTDGFIIQDIYDGTNSE